MSRRREDESGRERDREHRRREDRGGTRDRRDERDHRDGRSRSSGDNSDLRHRLNRDRYSIHLLSSLLLNERDIYCIACEKPAFQGSKPRGQACGGEG